MKVTSTIRRFITFSMLLAGATGLSLAADAPKEPKQKQEGPSHPFGPELLPPTSSD